MNYWEKLSPGDFLAATSYLIAVIVFIYSMKPRLDFHDKQFVELADWKKDHEQRSRETDGAINQMAVALAGLASTLAESVKRLDRIEGSQGGRRADDRIN